jgi:hypothetical protein
VGGILGAGTVKAGFGVIVWSGLGKTLGGDPARRRPHRRLTYLLVDRLG